MIDAAAGTVTTEIELVFVISEAEREYPDEELKVTGTFRYSRDDPYNVHITIPLVPDNPPLEWVIPRELFHCGGFEWDLITGEKRHRPPRFAGDYRMWTTSEPVVEVAHLYGPTPYGFVELEVRPIEINEFRLETEELVPLGDEDKFAPDAAILEFRPRTKP